jgi:restriction system protein
MELLDREKQQTRAQLHELLMGLHPQQFEAFAGKLLESVGFTDIEITNYIGDGGIDGYGNLEMGVVKVKAAFQVKRWHQNVPRPNIDQFRGAIQGKFDQGIFITTSDFSEEAKKASSVPGAVPIVLINGDKVVDIMLEKGLGVKQEPLTITRLDEEFFRPFGATEE